MKEPPKKPGMARGLGFKRWEKALIGLSALLFVVSSAFYFSGISLRKYVLGWDDEPKMEQVGVLSSKKGELRRLRNSSTEFETILPNQTLYNYDTIITGQSSGGTVSLDDGSTIELGPNTMVRLIYETRLSLQGISRQSLVNVVAGQVKGKSKERTVVLKTKEKVIPVSSEAQEAVQVKPAAPVFLDPASIAAIAPSPPPPPTPTPAPTPPPEPISTPEPTPSPTPRATPTPTPTPTPVPIKVVPISPAPNARLRLDRMSEELTKEIEFSWDVSPGSLPLVLIVQNGKNEILHRQVVEPQSERASTKLRFSEPGTYVWGLRHANGEKFSKPVVQTFAIEPVFEGIELLNPLVGGAELNSSAYSGEHLDNFDITFRWKPHPKAKSSRILLLASANSSRPIFSKVVQGNYYTFNKDKVYDGQIYFQIESQLPGGFIARSVARPFIFNFLPPVPISPKSGSTKSIQKVSSGEDTLLLTWQKTNFTDYYEIEISTDPKFEKPLLKKEVTENFFLLKSLSLGRYWWRVRSHSKSMASPYSKPLDITVVD